MKVVLSHDWLTGMRGGEKCLERIAAMYPPAEIRTLVWSKGKLSAAIESHPIRTSFLQLVPDIERRYKHFLPLFPAAIGSFGEADCDLVISTSHCVAKSLPAKPRVPHVCYCFTPMRYAWLFFDEYFGSYPFWAKPFIRALLARLRAWDKKTAARVTHFIAISDHVKKRIREYYGRDASVVYPPVNTEYYSPGPARRDEYFLIVSALVPYKRVDLAVRVLSRLGMRLVVVGDGPMAAELKKTAGHTVTFEGRQPDSRLREHYRACRALIFPGEEDFGIVPVEAQACGAPVVAYAKGGAAETVVDDLTGIYFYEQTEKALEDAVLRASRKTWDPEIIRKNAERFSSARFDREFKQTVERVMGVRDRGLVSK